jgi:hypothetical protein
MIMAAFCIRAGGSECDGCGRCAVRAEIIGRCAHCRDPIRMDEEYYNIAELDVLVHEDCLRDYFAKDLVTT